MTQPLPVQPAIPAAHPARPPVAFNSPRATARSSAHTGRRSGTKGGWLTPRMVAGYLRMHPRTLKQLCADGFGPPFMISPTGHYYFGRADLERWLGGGAAYSIAALSARDFLTHAEAADQLGISGRTLRKWREREYGPDYYYFGPRLYRYHRQELANWLAANSHRPNMIWQTNRGKRALAR